MNIGRSGDDSVDRDILSVAFAASAPMKGVHQRSWHRQMTHLLLHG